MARSYGHRTLYAGLELHCDRTGLVRNVPGHLTQISNLSMDPLTVPKFPFWNVISPREKVSILLIARMETLAIVCNIVFSIECKSYLTIFNLSSFYSPLNNWPIEIFILEIEFTIRFDSSFFSFFEWIDDIVDTCDYPYSVILYSTANIFFFLCIHKPLDKHCNISGFASRRPKWINNSYTWKRFTCRTCTTWPL